jgi:hypothetical protein
MEKPVDKPVVPAPTQVVTETPKPPVTPPPAMEKPVKPEAPKPPVNPPAAMEKPVKPEEPKLQQVFTKQEYLQDAPPRKEENKPEPIASATSDEQTT